MPQLMRKRLIRVKLETTYGTDSSPAGSDALLVRDLNITPVQSEMVSRDLVRPYLGASEQLLANTRVECTFQVELAGSGTAGTAPKFGAVLRACGMSETVTASAVSGTATAGGLNTITLAAGASAVNDFYKGQILSITAGSGSGTVAMITGYTGSTKVATFASVTGVDVTAGATSVYSIAANVAYKPVSTGFEAITIYYDMDGVLHRATGCRGTFALSGEVGQIPVINFTMTGIYNPPTDTALPSVTYTAQAKPLVFKSGNTNAFSLLSFTSCLQSLSFDIGNTLIYRELVNCAKQVLITDRRANGTVVIEAPTIAQKDYFTAAVTDGAFGDFRFMHGNTVTNIVSMISSTIDIADPTYQDANGIAHLSIPYTAVPTTAGNDEAILIFS